VNGTLQRWRGRVEIATLAKLFGEVAEWPAVNRNEVTGSGLKVILSVISFVRGEVAEWSKARDSKSRKPQKGFEGSNPSLSASLRPRRASAGRPGLRCDVEHKARRNHETGTSSARKWLMEGAKDSTSKFVVWTS
jgi:hypothetical protein